MQSDVCSAGEERGYWTTPAMRPFAMWSASLNLDTLGLGAPDSSYCTSSGMSAGRNGWNALLKNHAGLHFPFPVGWKQTQRADKIEFSFVKKQRR
jgi:hypothetical protein